MQYHGMWRFALQGLCVTAEAHDIPSDLWSVLAIVTSIQSSDHLSEDAPHEVLVGHLATPLEILYVSPKISVLTVLHVYVQVRSGFDVLTLVVGDDVGVSQAFQDGELCLQLFSLPRRHLKVADFLAAEDLRPYRSTLRVLLMKVGRTYMAVCFPPDLADNTEGSMACRSEFISKRIISQPIAFVTHQSSRVLHISPLQPYFQCYRTPVTGARSMYEESEREGSSW